MHKIENYFEACEFYIINKGPWFGAGKEAIKEKEINENNANCEALRTVVDKFKDEHDACTHCALKAAMVRARQTIDDARAAKEKHRVRRQLEQPSASFLRFQENQKIAEKDAVLEGS